MPTKQISKINYNGETYQLIDETISSIYAPIGHTHMMSDLADPVQGIYYVTGTQTEATGSWTGSLSTVSALYNGLTIAYYLPYAGSGNASLTLNLATATTTAIPVYYTGTTRATTQYGAGSVIILTYVDGTWRRADYNANDNTVPATYVGTASDAAAKTGSHTRYSLLKDSYTLVTLRYGNTVQGKITLNINSAGAKTIYINGAISSANNYTLPAGTYLVYYDGTNYYFRTDGKITGSITGDAASVNGHSVLSDVPVNAQFTDTTYSFDNNSGLVTTGTTISIGTVPVSHGGTGTTSLTSGQVLIGNGQSAIGTRAIDTTSGGTQSSSSLITSGAVWQGLSVKADSGHTHQFSELGIATDGVYNGTTNPLATVSTVSSAVSAITASSLGLGNVLHFIGFSTGTMSDGQTEVPTISGKSSYTPEHGDVVIDHNSAYEYVYTTANKWERFGVDGSYVPIGTEISFRPTGSISSTDAATGSNYTPKGSINTQSFYGSSTAVTVEGTPAGNVTINQFTPAGSITSAFSGSQATINVSGELNNLTAEGVSYTPAGSIITGTVDASHPANYTPSGTVKINNNNTIIVAVTPSGGVTSSFSGSPVRLTGTFHGTAGNATVSGQTSGVSADVTPTYSALTMTVSDEVLSYSWTSTASTSTVKILAGVSVGIQQGSISGTAAYTPTGTITIGTGTGTANYTPSGTITSTFTGQAENFSTSVTPTFTGSGALLTFSGTATTLTPTINDVSFSASGTYTPQGSVTSTFSGTPVTPTAVFQGSPFNSSGTVVPTGTIQQATFTGSGTLLTFSGGVTTITL